MKLCIIVSNYYPTVSKMLINGAVTNLKKNKITNFKIIYVPGTFEIPVLISNLINKFDAFIVLGCVIKGETPHFHYLCSSVFESLTNLSVQTKKPIGNGILTCNNKSEALKRANPNKKNKGGDASNAVISVLNLIK
jgi:6,7-dimethyl-8-ribityllumazine synthase|tara:strand:+ start:726 stop:1133 length:408 start_codon:yes stop_codon:yes gene_type:complete